MSDTAADGGRAGEDDESVGVLWKELAERLALRVDELVDYQDGMFVRFHP